MKIYFALILLFLSTPLLAKEPYQLELQVCPEIKIPGGEWMDYKLIPKYKNTASAAGLILLKYIEENLPIKVSKQPETPFSRQLAELQQGKIDAILGLYNVKSRRQEFNLSSPFYEEPLYLFALDTKFPNNKEIAIADLNGLVTGIRRDASYGDVIDGFYESEKSIKIAVKDTLNVGQLLLKGRIDYFIGTGTSEYLLQSISKKIKRYNQISSQPTSFAMSKESACSIWLPVFNQIIESKLSNLIEQYNK